MADILARIKPGLASGERSFFVHCDGTRSRSCRTPVQRLSSLFLDMAVELDVPVVPVRFIGGLPVEKDKGVVMYGAYRDNACVGFVAVEKANDDVFYMERLAVLPEYRHNGYGRELIGFVTDYVGNNGGKKVSIGIINENRRLKDWYISCGFVETGTRKFEHLPFEVCFMERAV
jgi:ribosomal protein S18 acetylase RimI-like enzyme